MRNVIIILLLCLTGMAYGQSELKEIRTGDMHVYTSDSSAVAFSYRYPKSFRVRRSTHNAQTVIFYRGNAALLNVISVHKKTEKSPDSTLLYNDTTTIRHYHTSWRNAPHDKTEDTVTINGRTWKSTEFAVEADLKSGKTMYDRERIYTSQVGDQVISVVYVISLTTNAEQTAKLFDEYKDTFALQMKTLQVKE